MSDPRAGLALMHFGQQPIADVPNLYSVTAWAADTRNPGESDAALIARTKGDVPALPPYNADFSDSSNPPGEEGNQSNVFIVVATDTCFVLQSQLRAWHFPTATAYLKVWFQSPFVPLSGPTTYTQFVYEWTGTGEPCLPVPAEAYNANPDNVIVSGDYDVPIPSTNGQPGNVNASIYKWSFIKGYVPPDDGSANGFPPI